MIETSFCVYKTKEKNKQTKAHYSSVAVRLDWDSRIPVLNSRTILELSFREEIREGMRNLEAENDLVPY